MVILTMAVALAYTVEAADDGTLNREDYIPTPDRSQVQSIDQETLVGLIDPNAVAAYQEGYSHMRDKAWFQLQPSTTKPESTEAMGRGVDTRDDGQGKANGASPIPIDGDEGGVR